jgi:hypothetical protein
MGRGIWIGIVVRVNIECEHGNWLVRRKLEPAIGIVLPCGFISSTWGWSLLYK